MTTVYVLFDVIPSGRDKYDSEEFVAVFATHADAKLAARELVERSGGEYIIRKVSVR